jgi:hypothetical protein
MEEGEGQCVRGRRNNFLVALASINHSATWNGGESGKKKKCPLHSTLKRIFKKLIFFRKGQKRGEREEPKNYIFVGRGGKVDIVLMQPPWSRIPYFLDHPSPMIQCNQSSKEAGKNGTRKDIFEGICKRWGFSNEWY